MTGFETEVVVLVRAVVAFLGERFLEALITGFGIEEVILVEVVAVLREVELVVRLDLPSF